MTSKVVLSIDPGSSKCGIALVERDANGRIHLLDRSIAPVDTLEAVVERMTANGVAMAIVGGGTRSRETVARLRALMPSLGILVVDEKDTSLQARERYWEQNPRKGWRKLLPATLQIPPEPVDDFVALILAERVLMES